MVTQTHGNRVALQPISRKEYFKGNSLMGHPSGIYGAGEPIRTVDLLITSQLLYQLSYTGSKGIL